MSLLLPPNIVIESRVNQKYLIYDGAQMITSTGEYVFSPWVKFELVQSNTGVGLVHIRNSYNRKFLRMEWEWDPTGPSLFTDNVAIIPAADQPEEDQSKWSCTLFKPLILNDSPVYDIAFVHVQSGRYAYASPTHLGGGMVRLSLHFVSLTPAGDNAFKIIDVESMVILPKHVAFKGANGKYLQVQMVNDRPYLTFTSPDKGLPESWFEVSTDGHGRVQILSYTNKNFWRYEEAKNWILAESSATTTVDDTELFWPVKINQNAIALRSFSSDNFCAQLSYDGMIAGLNAAYPTIAAETRLLLEELVLSRRIYNADFNLSNAIIYGETPITMATANASNNTSADNTVEFKFTYTDTRSSTWSTSHSWMVGMSVTASFSIIFVGSTTVEASAEYSGSYEWGEAVTSENTLETTYTVVVPANTSISVSLMATKGFCDVPFTYYQRDVLYNGKTVVYMKEDGLYTGINSYNFRYETTTLTQARSEPETKEQKLPDPLTDPSTQQNLPLPFESTQVQKLSLLSEADTTQEPKLPQPLEQETTREVALPSADSRSTINNPTRCLCV